MTLRKKGKLRGCVGHTDDDMPLGEVVGSMALQAAFGDSRFSPVRISELVDIEIEISVLTPMTKVAGPEDVVLGRDGVVLRLDGCSAVFLPDVASEQGWSRDELLDQLCRKAGLRAGSWRRGAEFFIFQAIVFHESADLDPNHW